MPFQPSHGSPWTKFPCWLCTLQVPTQYIGRASSSSFLKGKQASFHLHFSPKANICYRGSSRAIEFTSLTQLQEYEWEEPLGPHIFSVDDDTLQDIFKGEFQTILSSSDYCHIREADEESWCDDVIRPTLKLALAMCKECRHQ